MRGSCLTAPFTLTSILSRQGATGVGISTVVPAKAGTQGCGGGHPRYSEHLEGAPASLGCFVRNRHAASTGIIMALRRLHKLHKGMKMVEPGPHPLDSGLRRNCE